MTKKFKFAGIGSRNCPQGMGDLCFSIGKKLAKRGWILRSGAANGADASFEQGCDNESGEKEIFLPWKGFNGSKSTLFPPSKEAIELARTIHPIFDSLTDAARLLHSRNCHQVLGQNLDDPVDLVICWTEGGKIKGGTATAINLAKSRNIPVFNLAIDKNLKDKILEIENSNIG